MKRLISSLILSACLLHPASAQEVVENARLGVKLQLAPGWYSEQLGANEGTLALSLRPSANPEDAVCVIRVVDARERSLASAWTLLRHAVVINLGGEVDSDKSLQVDGQPARELVYSGINTRGARRKFVRILTVAHQHLYVVHGVTSPGKFNSYLPAFHQMALSLQNWAVQPPAEATPAEPTPAEPAPPAPPAEAPAPASPSPSPSPAP